MELIFSFATDDKRNLKKDGHSGNARYFRIYKFEDGKWEFIEDRENKKIKKMKQKYMAIHKKPEQFLLLWKMWTFLQENCLDRI